MSPREKLAGNRVGAPGQAEVAQQLHGAIANARFVSNRRPRVHLERPIAPGECGNHHVLEQSQLTEDLRGLKHPADSRLVDLVRLHPEQRNAIEVDHAGIGLQAPDEAVE